MSSTENKVLEEFGSLSAYDKCTQSDTAARLETNGLVKAYLYLIFKEENLCAAEVALITAVKSKGMSGILRNRVKDIVAKLPSLSDEEKREEFHNLICNMKDIELSRQLKLKSEPEFEIETTKSIWNFIEQRCEELTITPSELVSALLIILIERKDFPRWIQKDDEEEISSLKDTAKEEIITIPVFTSDEYEQ